MTWTPKKAEPIRVRTPLPSQVAGGEDKQHPTVLTGKPSSSNPYFRAENEDDDGYDPYSDRREEAPLFEANPWS